MWGIWTWYIAGDWREEKDHKAEQIRNLWWRTHKPDLLKNHFTLLLLFCVALMLSLSSVGLLDPLNAIFFFFFFNQSPCGDTVHLETSWEGISYLGPHAFSTSAIYEPNTVCHPPFLDRFNIIKPCRSTTVKQREKGKEAKHVLDYSSLLSKQRKPIRQK